MYKYLLLAVALSACHPPGEWKYEYEHPCVAKIMTEDPLDEADMRYVVRNYNIARDMYEAFFPGDGWNSFCKLTNPHILWIHRGAFPCTQYNGTCGGFFSLTYGIEVLPRLSGLLHEALHARDTAHGVVSTTWHGGWDTNGYNTISEAYDQAIQKTP